MSCIDLIICTNQNIISKYGADASIFGQFRHNIIYCMARLTSLYLLHQNMSLMYGVTVKQMFKILKNILKTLVGEILLNPFFFYYVNEWKNLNAEVKNAKSIHILKKMFVAEKKENCLFSAYDPIGVKLLTRLRLIYSHLNKHKFRHGLVIQSTYVWM